LKLRIFPFFAPMNIRDAKKQFDTLCSTHFSKSEGDEIFSRIVEHLTSKSRLEIKLNKDIEVEDHLFLNITSELQTNKPIQYVLGYEWFYNLKLMVTEAVLIPRPETEELVRWIIDTLKENKIHNPSILDIGCGSGCIPIALKKELNELSVTAIDISESALNIAKKNADLYQLKIEFLQSDILNPGLIFDKKFDIIVSNPPYITSHERLEMDERVLSFEPNIALFVTNTDPFQFYKAILHYSEKNLNSNGIIFLELNSQFAHETESLFKMAGYKTTLRKDIYDNLRMLMASKN